MEYINTEFGKLRLDEIPIVEQEPMNKKFFKSMIFFSVIIIILLIILYKQWNPPHNAKVLTKPNINLKTVKSHVNATSILLQNIISEKPVVENIVINTVSGNMINFKPISLQNGSFKVDFGETLDISNIVLITGKSPCNYITNIDINLYEITHNGENKIWEYSGPLMDKSENTIHISKMYYNPEEKIIKTPNLPIPHKFDEKIIANINELAILLSENEEKYISY